MQSLISYWDPKQAFMNKLQKICLVSTLFTLILVLSAANLVNAIQVTSSIPLANPPVGIAYDSVKGEVFVAYLNSNYISVISDKTDAIVASVPVERGQSCLAYDSGRGEVFVGNDIDSTISVISDSTNTVVATFSVPGNVSSLAYDSAKGEIFVAYLGASYNQVSVILDSDYRVLATVPVYNANSLAYDSGMGEIFVANLGETPPISPGTVLSHDGYVLVISDQSNSVVANVTVGEMPQGLAYDSGKGEVFVADFGSPGSVISDESNSVVGNFTSLAIPTSIAYDPAVGEILVGNSIIGAVSIISDSTNGLVGNISMGSITAGTHLESMAYDSGKGEMFIADTLFSEASISGTMSIASNAALSSTLNNSETPEFGNLAFVVAAIAVVTICTIPNARRRRNLSGTQ
jgi:DNA-binding beta-propeller fold protein YncE